MTTNRASLESFLASFPDDARSWAQATDELPTMYAWLAEQLGLAPVGRENCRTPSQWNTKYKAAIRGAVRSLTTEQRRRFDERFGEWL